MAVDLFLPNVAVNVAVVSGTSWYSPIISLTGVFSVYAQVSLTNSAAGTACLNPTNADPILTPWLYNAAGVPFQANQATATIAASASSAVSIVNSAAGIGARGFYFQFIPTASGNLSVAINLTRIAT